MFSQGKSQFVVQLRNRRVRRAHTVCRGPALESVTVCVGVTGRGRKEIPGPCARLPVSPTDFGYVAAPCFRLAGCRCVPRVPGYPHNISQRLRNYLSPIASPAPRQSWRVVASSEASATVSIVYVLESFSSLCVSEVSTIHYAAQQRRIVPNPEPRSSDSAVTSAARQHSTTEQSPCRRAAATHHCPCPRPD